ncbi:MAG: TetR/AcrR family transcriptional regulator [Solirubrobacteraceae bacterium]|nr:TetR/AcrR family transcriptional regulator [Solirubrobacteraceae bacterium]
MSATPRLTRKEQQARTRATLLESASHVFAEKGLHRASIDDIASHAGFTKGAFYANFSSKEELFLEMLDLHFAERLAAIEQFTSTDEAITAQAEQVGREFLAALRGDEEWARLFLEFSSHATRHEAFRRELVARTDALRAGVTKILAARAHEAGITPTVPPALVARMTFAMAHGAATEQLLDDTTPSELFGTMLRLFFLGLTADAATPADPKDAHGH